MHRDLRGIDHQFVADTAECHGKILREMTDAVHRSLRMQVPGLQFEQLVAPSLQVIEQIAE